MWYNLNRAGIAVADGFSVGCGGFVGAWLAVRARIGICPSSVNFCAATRFMQAKISIAAGRTEKAGNGTVVFKMCNMRMSATRTVHIAGDPCFRQYPCKLCLRAVAFDDCTGIKRQIQWLRLLTLRYEFIILCNHARVNEACREKASCRLSAACPDAKLLPLESNDCFEGVFLW